MEQLKTFRKLLVEWRIHFIFKLRDHLGIQRLSLLVMVVLVLVLELEVLELELEQNILELLF